MKMSAKTRRFLCLVAATVMLAHANAQSNRLEPKAMSRLTEYFANYKPSGQEFDQATRILSYKLNNSAKTLVITVDGGFAAQEFTEKSTRTIYKKVKKALTKTYGKYKTTVMTNGMAIEDLVPDRLSDDTDKSRLWGYIEYKGEPWVRNVSEPIRVTHGLQNRHIALWASHGRYFDQQKGWKWQRPKLFCTTEDLFTQTIVVPYLMPMLQNAGAIVFSPRERDWQKNEVIVDNDDRQRGTHYIEVNGKHDWTAAPDKGFALHTGCYTDGENPFTAGTARMARTTSSKSKYSLVSYQPQLPAEGRYAVYVSYQTLPKSVDGVRYTVWHKGEQTEFLVNQKMGGGTWVYLGSFDFDKGCNEFNRVTVTNQSGDKGVVTTDAVRFGGGMGNIERGGSTSGLPRCLEGARYYAQWAGMPYSVYSTRNGTDDYSDDINVRSLMVNTLGGGSCYMPSTEGRKVPIELSLAVHSDAGYAKDGVGMIGSLAICTTNFNDGRLNAGISRLASRDFAKALLDNTTADMKRLYGNWNKRYLWDRNYSETRLPGVPSAILETMSHQNFPDMRYGQDPNFKFALARSIYKTILRYVCDQHGKPFIVEPLAPANVRVEVSDKGEAQIEWEKTDDPQETTASPTGYIVYTRCGTAGFDNGRYVRSATSLDMRLEPNVLYGFRIAAVNRGGKSFLSEEVCAMYCPNAKGNILLVDGFHRLSSPAVRDNASEQGFDMNADPGVTLGPTFGWVGRQTVYNRQTMGREDETGLGWSGDELTGVLVAGNDMNHLHTHAEAIAATGGYNIASASSHAVEEGRVELDKYRLIDLVLGLECNDGHSLKYYKTFSSMMQKKLRSYAKLGGNLFVSGSYIGSDMTSDAERMFLSDVLKCQWNGTDSINNGSATGLGTDLSFYNTINEEHYAATSPDCLQPVAPAFAAMKYTDGKYCCTAYDGSDRKAVAMGIPFECIKDKSKRSAIMRSFLKFLLK